MNYTSNDYEQMANVIDYLSQHYLEQPSLDKLAGIAGLSMHHFQRKFTAWVGITPKSFLQCLTYEDAKELLDQGKSVLEVTNSVGLSSPSRLHDLCLTLEAVSPGEIKCGGKGLLINYGFGPSPFGQCFIANSKRGVVHLSFLGFRSKEQAIAELKSEWPNADFSQDNQIAMNYIQKIFNHDGSSQTSLRAFVRGTKFQLRVWNALLEVASGDLISYGQLAKNIGQATATRAVGTAVGKNPLAYLIPCHRVIRGTGAIGNYRWGNGRKRIMIAYESQY